MPVVYSLTNPLTNKPYYVGFTKLTPTKRLLGHIIQTLHPTTKMLVDNSLVPIINILEEGESVTQATETYYINKYINDGFELENKSRPSLDQPLNFDSLTILLSNIKTQTGEVGVLKTALEMIRKELPLSSCIPIMQRIKNIVENAISLT